MGAKNPASEVSERPAAALAPALTPHGRLHLAALEDAPALPEDVSGRLREAFDRGAGHGLRQLGAGEVGTTLPAVFSYWRELGSLFVTALCTTPEAGDDAGRAPSPRRPRARSSKHSPPPRRR